MKITMQVLKENLTVHKSLLEKVMADECLNNTICECAELICNCLERGGKILLCGNGGSAADAMHLTAEFVGNFYRPKQPQAAICLNTNAATMTSLANDSDYRFVFSKQLEAIGKRGDVLLVFTTSGKSVNILEVLKAAKESGMTTISFCGEDVSRINSDYVIAIPSADTPRIQEMHLLLGHCIAQYVEDYFLNGVHNG